MQKMQNEEAEPPMLCLLVLRCQAPVFTTIQCVYQSRPSKFEFLRHFRFDFVPIFVLTAKLDFSNRTWSFPNRKIGCYAQSRPSLVRRDSNSRTRDRLTITLTTRLAMLPIGEMRLVLKLKLTVLAACVLKMRRMSPSACGIRRWQNSFFQFWKISLEFQQNWSC